MKVHPSQLKEKYNATPNELFSIFQWTTPQKEIQVRLTGGPLDALMSDTKINHFDYLTAHREFINARMKKNLKMLKENPSLIKEIKKKFNQKIHLPSIVWVTKKMKL